MIQGKVFYQHGSYDININDLSANETEQIIKALKGTVFLRRVSYFG